MTPKRAALRFVRTGLPLTIAIAGFVLLATGDFSSKSNGRSGAGVVLLGVALMVWMLNWLFRMSLDSNSEREREEMAREYYDRHGHWPDEADSPGADSRRDSPGGEFGRDSPAGEFRRDSPGGEFGRDSPGGSARGG